MNLTPEQLLKIAPRVGAAAGVYVGALNAAMSRYCINTPQRAAHFLAQIAHESGDFGGFRENLNYTPEAILNTFNTRTTTRFTMSQAGQYGRTAAHAADQKAIANIAYANRMGNGDEKSGDGWRYRGAGWIQITGRDNHREVAGALAIIGDIGEYLSTVPGAAASAAWFWWKTGCNRFADGGNVDAISDLINIGHRTDRVGDSVGYDKRLSLTKHCLQVLS